MQPADGHCPPLMAATARRPTVWPTTCPRTQSTDCVSTLKLSGWSSSLTNDLVDGLPPLSAEDIAYLRSLPADFTDDRRARLAALEAQTRHDVKAVEYLVREHILAHTVQR
jgi:hypothetical protein